MTTGSTCGSGYCYSIVEGGRLSDLGVGRSEGVGCNG